MSIPLALLKKVRCRFLCRESGSPVAGVVASLSLGIGTSTNQVKLPVGSLCSDQAGYLSFDLKALIGRGIAAADQLWLSSPQLPAGEIDLLSLLLQGHGDGQGTANRLQAFEAVGPAASNLPADGPGFCLVFPVYVAGQKDAGGKQVKSNCAGSSLPSVQAPDACDYRASPYSFVTPVNAALGDGSCETMVPSTLPLQEHRFYKVVVRRDATEEKLKPLRRMNSASAKISEVRVTEPLTTSAPRLKFAEVLEFRQQWHSLGHSLGEIKYSLALAPGEATQIAIIDWSREDSIARSDNVSATEYMDHSLKRDRSIEETIDSALKETQGGNSFMAGTSGQATIPLQYVTLSFNHAIGGSVSNSWGNRNLEADSLQDIHDRIRQQTGYTRSLNSTVIVQASQSEKNVLQTRKVANHNHCHALTIQYYEVLRHFTMRTEFAGRRKALLVPFRPFAFTWDIALQFRTILENVLLDASLQKCFDAVFRLNKAPAIYDVKIDAPAPGNTPAASTSTRTISKTLDVQGTLGESVASGVTVKSGDNIRITASGELTMSILGWTKGPNGDTEAAGNNFLAPGLKKYSLIYKIGMVGPWQQAGSYAQAYASREGEIIFGVNDENGAFEDNKGGGHDAWSVTVEVPSHEPAEPAPPADPTPAGEPAATSGFVREQDELCNEKLLMHLNGNQGYYNSCIWIMQSPVDRRIHIEAALAGYPDVLDALDDTPIAVSGNYVAFPYDGPFPQWQDTRPDDPKHPVEDIVTLPTRGLFAEAQLGHCNACEERDPTRMWDWNEMTIETPPDIGGITPGPKGQTPSVTPAALPGNVIQITQPPAAPDPTGLAAALKVLGTPDIFRDMSGLDEVSKLLETLSKESSEANIKAMALQAKEKLDQAKTGSDAKAGSGGGSGSGSGKTRAPASEPDAAKQVDRVKAIEYAQSKGLADDQTAQDATKGVLGGEEIASTSDFLPADYQSRKGVFPPAATTDDKIKKVLALFGDAPFSSASDINQLFASLSSSNISGYVEWLESRKRTLNFAGGSGGYKWIKGAAGGRPKQFNFSFQPQTQNNFVRLWDGIPDIYGPAHDAINLIEFLALDLATHIEGYGDYEIVSEAQREGYGLDYFFEPNWVAPSNIMISKASYNTLPTNRTAGDLFADADFQAAHNELLPASTAWRITDPLWNGADYFATQAPKSASSNETAFIRQADFYKFRGRGYIQTTNRANYRTLARLLRKNLDKLPSPLWSLVESWGPENASDAELNFSLTTSRDSDWNNLFGMTGGVVAHLGVRAFSESKSNCLQIDCTKAALDNDGQGTVAFLGNKINGYGGALSAAVTAILVEMYDSLT